MTAVADVNPGIVGRDAVHHGGGDFFQLLDGAAVSEAAGVLLVRPQRPGVDFVAQDADPLRQVIEFHCGVVVAKYFFERPEAVDDTGDRHDPVDVAVAGGQPVRGQIRQA